MRQWKLPYFFSLSLLCLLRVIFQDAGKFCKHHNVKLFSNKLQSCLYMNNEWAKTRRLFTSLCGILFSCMQINCDFLHDVKWHWWQTLLSGISLILCYYRYVHFLHHVDRYACSVLLRQSTNAVQLFKYLNRFNRNIESILNILKWNIYVNPHSTILHTPNTAITELLWLHKGKQRLLSVCFKLQANKFCLHCSVLSRLCFPRARIESVFNCDKCNARQKNLNCHLNINVIEKNIEM